MTIKFIKHRWKEINDMKHWKKLYGHSEIYSYASNIKPSNTGKCRNYSQNFDSHIFHVIKSTRAPGKFEPLVF